MEYLELWILIRANLPEVASASMAPGQVINTVNAAWSKGAKFGDAIINISYVEKSLN